MGKIAAGVLLGGYEATRFKNKAKTSPLQTVEVLSIGSGVDTDSAIAQAKALARGTVLARRDSFWLRCCASCIAWDDTLYDLQGLL